MARAPSLHTSPSSFVFLRVDDVIVLVKDGEPRAVVVERRGKRIMITLNELESKSVRLSKNMVRRIRRALEKLRRMSSVVEEIGISEKTRVVVRRIPPSAAILVSGVEVMRVTAEGYIVNGNLARSAAEKARALAEAKRVAEELGEKPEAIVKAVVLAAKKLRETLGK